MCGSLTWAMGVVGDPKALTVLKLAVKFARHENIGIRLTWTFTEDRSDKA